jgi:hypothetical protein
LALQIVMRSLATLAKLVIFSLAACIFLFLLPQTVYLFMFRWSRNSNCCDNVPV